MYLLLLQVPPDTVAKTANNYLAIVQSMANRLMDGLNSAMNNVMPIGTIMKLSVAFMAIVLAFHIVSGILRGIQEGNPRGLLGEVVLALWEHGPRVVIFLMFALGAAGVSMVGRSPGGGEVKLNPNSYYVEGTEPLRGTFSQALGFEGNTYPGPTAQLKTSIQKAIQAIDAFNWLWAKDRIELEIMNMQEAGDQAVSSTKNSIATKTLESILGTLVKDIVAPFFEFGTMLAAVASQYLLAKNLVGILIYCAIAWRMALHFLPLMVVMAYFRSLQGFLMNTAKQLLALSLAAAIMGMIATKLFGSDFWFGTNNPIYAYQPGGANPYALHMGEGLIGRLLKNQKITSTEVTTSPFSLGSYPWIKDTFYTQMMLIQLAALFSLIGVILGEIFSIVRSALDGAMRSSHSGSIQSTFGR